MNRKLSLKSKVLSVLVAGALSFMTFEPAHAFGFGGFGGIVLDPSNLAQNILSAERALVQIQNQVLSLQHEGQMLLNDAKNLKSLDFNALSRLRETIAATQRLFDEAQGLAFTVNRVRDQFAELYPALYNDTFSNAQLAADEVKRWQNSRDALGTAMELQAQTRESIASDESVLSDLIERSQSAAGALSAQQATNQMLALQVRQLMQVQELQVAQDRAVALEHARAVAEEERARELHRRFMTPATPYRAAPVGSL